MKASKIKNVLLTGSMFIFLLSLTTSAQNFKDCNGNVYKTVSYGLQVWTAVNLNTSYFRNGDLIPEAKTPEEWIAAAEAGQPAWCYYENNPENGRIYGRLYNWFAINDKRGITPEGWHVAVNVDWSTLIKNLKGVDIAGTRLKSKEGWKTRKGTNDIGFGAIPGGYRDTEGKFKDMGRAGQWWSNSVPVDVKPSDKIFSLMLSDNSIEAKFLQSEKGAGFSVRCEKD